jgi:hypothetical protein
LARPPPGTVSILLPWAGCSLIYPAIRFRIIPRTQHIFDGCCLGLHDGFIPAVLSAAKPGNAECNVFKEGELVKDSVWAKFAYTAADGKDYNVDYYNLDVIISVGYRVKSIRVRNSVSGQLVS